MLRGRKKLLKSADRRPDWKACNEREKALVGMCHKYFNTERILLVSFENIFYHVIPQLKLMKQKKVLEKVKIIIILNCHCQLAPFPAHTHRTMLSDEYKKKTSTWNMQQEIQLKFKKLFCQFFLYFIWTSEWAEEEAKNCKFPCIHFPSWIIHSKCMCAERYMYEKGVEKL